MLHVDHGDGRSTPRSTSRVCVTVFGATTTGGGESHSHDSWLGTPDRGYAPLDLSSTVTGVLEDPGRPVMQVFNPASTLRGLVLLAPGGGQDHTSPGVFARATRITRDG